MSKPENVTRTYPVPNNPVVDDVTPADQAIYVPAVTKGFAIDVINPNVWRRPLPSGLQHTDLNFLDPKGTLFRVSHVLTSAGLALKQKRPCMITTRDRSRTCVIADSGGYQIASNRLKIRNDQDRLNILRWQERIADIAISLDVPTGPVGEAKYQYKTFADCLTATLDHLDFYQKNRRSSSVRFLNVLQGNNQADCDTWYRAVRKKFTGEGWAFAGPQRHNMYQLCRRILTMCDDGEIAEKSWIHVLGTSRLDVAVLLTTLQRAINKYGINRNLRISYDTSTPFRILRWHQAIGLPNTARDLSMKFFNFPNDQKMIGCTDVRWPWSSPLGDVMKLGDFCVPKSKPASRYYCDQQSYHYLAHHNLAALCFGINHANRIFDAQSLSAEPWVGAAVGEAAAAIDEIMKTQSRGVLEKHRAAFEDLPFGDADTHPEDERDFGDITPKSMG